jgi:hypothetical protein
MAYSICFTAQWIGEIELTFPIYDPAIQYLIEKAFAHRLHKPVVKEMIIRAGLKGFPVNKRILSLITIIPFYPAGYAPEWEHQKIGDLLHISCHDCFAEIPGKRL